MAALDDLVANTNPKPKPLRLLFFDIETAPMVAYIWRLKTDYVGTHMLHHDTFMLSWSAKWSDESKVRSGVLTPSEAKAQDDSRIVNTLSRLMKQADYVVAHNGDRFDIPHVNTRVLVNGLDPLGQVDSIDTLKLARQSFNLASNKLDYLADVLGFDGKHETTMELWDQCYRGHGPSLKRMVEYNRQDVVLLEEIFHALIPYVKKLPRLVEFTEYRQEGCPTCGADKTQRVKLDKPKRTGVNDFTKFQCTNCKREYRYWQSIGNHKAGSVGL